MRVRAVAFLVLSVVALQAHPSLSAQELAIEGRWGNTAGCKYAADNVYGDDDMILLEPGSIESFVLGCSWLQVLTTGNGTQVATGLCGHEGEETETVETFIIKPSPSDPAALRISFADGNLWGEVRKCP